MRLNWKSLLIELIFWFAAEVILNCVGQVTGIDFTQVNLADLNNSAKALLASVHED